MLEEEFGFEHDKLKALKGGLQGWQAAGYPIETGAAVRPAGKLATTWGRLKSASF